MDNDLRQRLASAAEADPMVREALRDIEWLDGRPFEEFPAYWHARLNGGKPDYWQREAASDPLLKDAAAYEKQVIQRMFCELEAIAWRRGYVDSSGPRGALDLDQVGAYAKQQYPIGELQEAYFHGFFEARQLLLLKAKATEFATLMAELEKRKSNVH
jgi:hypothetical protein